MHRFMVLGLCALVTTGCAVTTPVAVVGQNGEVLKGTATATMADGTFEASNAKLRCHGNYDPHAQTRTVAVAVKCSDGRAGVGIAIRDSGTSGSGVINMNDGSKATFIFGAGASAL